MPSCKDIIRGKDCLVPVQGDFYFSDQENVSCYILLPSQTEPNGIQIYDFCLHYSPFGENSHTVDSLAHHCLGSNSLEMEFCTARGRNRLCWKGNLKSYQEIL